MEDLQLHDAVVFLAAAGLVIPVVKHLRISPVLGFLLIGLAIGPHGLARFVEDYTWLRYLLITDTDGVHTLAELGVVFLLFMIGLELSFERLWAMRRLVFGMGSAQIVVTGTVITGIAWVFDNTLQASVLLGSCLALSSTAVVIQLLIEQGRFGTTVGRGCFAVLLAQDMAVVPILFLVGTFGAHLGESVVLELGLALGEALIAVLLILGIGRLVIRPVLRFVGASDSPELFMAVTLLVIIATATATHAAGLSAALGAFLAGLLLAESEYRHEIEVNIEPFKGLLLGLFFMSVGMGIDLAQIINDPVWVALSIIGLFALKSAVMTVIARLYRFEWPHAVEIGLLLGQGGEFAFVVVGLAMGFELLPTATAQFMLIVVGGTVFLTPLVTRIARVVGDALTARSGTIVDETLGLAPDLAGHVIIVGYGRTGQLLAGLLDKQQIPHVALDLDADRVTKLQAAGVPIQLGDARRAAMLEKTHLRSAGALAICTDDPGATERILLTARRVSPDTPIVVRARDTAHAASLLALGADHVVPELLESGLQLGHVMLEAIGFPAAAARDLIETQRIATELGTADSAANR
jgi:monovalent cation:proton antiporter-2 (CPA2) family protein